MSAGEESHRINIANGLLLYYHRYSYYSQKVLLALYEKNLRFETHVVDIVNDAQYEPWFIKLNPRGEVPVLQDIGKIIPDSIRIIDYLEDNFSNGDTPRLIPLDQGDEIKQKTIHFRNIIDQLPARILTIGSFYHSELVRWPKPPFIGPVRGLLATGEKNIGKKLRECAENNPEARDVLLQKAVLHEQKSVTITNKDEYLKVLQRIEETLTEVEAELASHGEGKQDWWLCTDRFTVADIALTVLLVRLNELGYQNRFWKNGVRPYLEKYFLRVECRDSYKKTIPTLSFHAKMFIATYKKPLIIGISVAVVAVIVGGYYLFNEGQSFR